MILISTWVPFTVILLNAVISATLRIFHPFDSRQDVTKRPGSYPLLCTKSAMMLKPKTAMMLKPKTAMKLKPKTATMLKPKKEVSFKSGNLAVRARYFDGLLFGYTSIRNSFILLYNIISSKITSEIPHFIKR